MTVEARIRAKLTEGLTPARLQVENESSKHAGHEGLAQHHAAHTGETHFRVMVVSAAFEDKSRVERHRMVNALLSEELSGPVHALAIKALTPAEAAGK